MYSVLSPMPSMLAHIVQFSSLGNHVLTRGLTFVRLVTIVTCFPVRVPFCSQCSKIFQNSGIIVGSPPSIESVVTCLLIHSTSLLAILGFLNHLYSTERLFVQLLTLPLCFMTQLNHSGSSSPISINSFPIWLE